MLLQDVRYELCTENTKGFNPHPRIFRALKTMAEAQEALDKWRYLYPNDGTFLVRTVMTRITKKMKKSQARLKAV